MYAMTQAAGSMRKWSFGYTVQTRIAAPRDALKVRDGGGGPADSQKSDPQPAGRSEH